MDIITLSMGSGGKSSSDFVEDMILKNIGNDILNNLTDSAYIHIDGETAYTTDSFVVQPEFFPGGNIGDLAVYGTCNDLAVSGAKPLYLSLSLVIPEGYQIDTLGVIISSIGKASKDIGVQVVCGDTKVVERESLKGIIINTSGIGRVVKKLNDYKKIKIGDAVIFTSDIARHGMAILLARGDLKFNGNIQSDSCHLYNIFDKIGYKGIEFARDATRGGVAAVLNEIAAKCHLGFLLKEKNIVIKKDVKYLCEMLGFDPFSVANEGVAVMIVSKEHAEEILHLLKQCDEGENASIVGEVVEKKGVALNTLYGGTRNVDIPAGILLPRIC